MESITDKIRSIRETVGVSYVKPDPNKVQGFIDALGANLEATEYLKGRGLLLDTIQKFRLGYCKEFNAISIPIYKSGDLVNIKYRTLDKEAKSKYLSEKGGEVWIFNDEGVDIGLKKGGVLVVEGEFDCMMVWQSGIPNVISPASGKDSFGAFLEVIDKVKRIYIAYDNDEGGKNSAFKMAERLGLDKCNEVIYEAAKDANEFIQNGGDVRDLIRKSRPFTSRQFKSLGDIISTLRAGEKEQVKTDFIPKVNLQNGWMAVISGRSNVGKTAFVLNIANEITSRGIPTLILPFERGIESVGERFLNIMSDLSSSDFASFAEGDWDKMVQDAASKPLYFAMPTKEETCEVIAKAHRFFDIKVVIIDHLDYMIRQVTSSRGDAIMDTLQQLKRVAEDNSLILLVVSHIRKTEAPGQFIAKSKKPNIEDLKGSSSLYQDPEVVVMLSETLEDNQIAVDVLKNKGSMECGVFDFNRTTGVFKPLAVNEGPTLQDIWNRTP